MKQCQYCGAPIGEGEKFCAGCGKPVEAAAQEPAQTADNAVSPNPDPTPEQNSNPDPTPEQNPNPDPTPEQNPNPIPGAIPNPIPDAAASSDAVPPKKKKKTWKLVLAIVIPIVLVIIIAFAVLFFFANSLINRGTENVDHYWQAYVDCDSQKLVDSVPDAYWDYISEEYGYSEAECKDGVAYLMAEKQETLGETLSYTWERKGFAFGSGNSDTLSEVRDQLEEFGLECSSGVGITVDATLSGDISDEDYHNLGMWTVKIDGDWYDVTAMVDIDTLCENGYVEMAQYEKLYREPIMSYWNAFYANDVDAISALMPSQLWDFLEETYDADQATAEGYMQQYINDILVYSELQDATITFTPTIIGVEAYDADEVDDLNEFLGDGLKSENYQTVYYDYTMDADGESMDDSSSSVMMQLGDTWYIYDGIYYFIDACYYYG